MPRDLAIAVPDPVYPVYVDTNVMAGRTAEFRDGRYQGLVYLESTKDNGFVPSVPKQKVDLVYLCFPNNPTGSTISTKQLQAWVDYARDAKALILYDAAYEVYIRDAEVPHSIYEVDGARRVAVEFRSFSKTAGFTGTRCAYTVVPKECVAWDAKGGEHALNPLWNRRQTTKMNGVSYPVQRAAEAVFSPEGQQQVRELADYYLRNAAADPRRLREARLRRRRRAQRALRLGADRRRLVGLLQHAPGQGRGRLHARQRLRPLRRGVCPLQRLQLAGEHRARAWSAWPRRCGGSGRARGCAPAARGPQ